MAIEQFVDRLETTTTRRTVVKTGAKLAYAAPLVAVTMKLSSHGAAADAISGSSNTCPPGLNFCRIGEIGGCNDDSLCLCLTTTEGGEFCADSANPATVCPPIDETCASSADCPGGFCVENAGGLCCNSVNFCVPNSIACPKVRVEEVSAEGNPRPLLG